MAGSCSSSQQGQGPAPARRDLPVAEPVVASGERAAMAQQTVLITGGSGYLGQFLVEDFAKTDKVPPERPLIYQPSGFRVSGLTP